MATMISVPYAHDKKILFPQQCVYCLKPATAVQTMVIRERVDVPTAGGGQRTYHFREEATVPYCAEHMQLSDEMSTKLATITNISFVVGFLAGLAGCVETIQEGLEAGLAFVALFLVGYLGTYFPLKVILSLRYPMIRHIGGGVVGSGALGIEGKLATAVLVDEKTNALKGVKVQAVELKFRNSEYADLFAEANNIIRSWR